MQNDSQEGSQGRSRFVVEVNHMARLEQRIAAGDMIDGPDLAAVLRQHGSRPIPDAVLDYLCRFLEGSISKPKGRRPLPELDRRKRDMIIADLYHRYLGWLAARARRYGHPAGWTSLDYPPPNWPPAWWPGGSSMARPHGIRSKTSPLPGNSARIVVNEPAAARAYLRPG
ncbi:hypothetical protein D3874_17750 [Oleomonas cavernae]|uniref:Uncharacterized protein n=1 Tax=Oleomonas cavernae TaxID=2320859 RepID=A0A418WF57_9PROT|nr:hypothetical protein [Oleomonas cavernae]RJF88612.1 hypothetical protein D3874_17750 [Oleomonas cavernae]